MIPIKFKESNVTYAKPESMTDEECVPLPAYRGEGQIICCWKMSFRERLKAVFTGVMWIGLLSTVQPPLWLSVDRPFIRQRKETGK